MINKIFVHGFPGLYGGAGTELHHQIAIWQNLNVEVHLIPTHSGYENEPLYGEMIESGVVVHDVNDWSNISCEDPVIGFCNSEFLRHLPTIRERTGRTIFVNCMTWIFDKEKEEMAKGNIAMFLYQNEEVMNNNEPQLRSINNDENVQFMTFSPYFKSEIFPFVAERSSDHFGCGRISREDADKFSRNTLHIYEYFVSPKWKQGTFLGFGHRAEQKIGKPFDWIRIATNHKELSQQEFYRRSEIILQPSDTTENWPRVGFEAMSSGSVLIVDNRGGWRQQVKHGVTGWLCNHERDFIYYASKMAYEPNQRADMAEAAKIRGVELGGFEKSKASWEEVFDRISKLPI